MFGELTNNIIEKLLENFEDHENKQKIQKYLLSPVALYIEGYLKPYFLTLVICLLSIILLLIYNTKLLLDVSSSV